MKGYINYIEMLIADEVLYNYRSFFLQIEKKLKLSLVTYLQANKKL